jgi:hypothetical protein
MLIGCAGIVIASPARAAAPATEAELKAVLLFHLTQFVTWPSASSNQSEFVIGILGPDPFGPALDAVIKGENVKGRPIRVIRSNNVRALSGCSLIYLSPQLRDVSPRIFDEFENPPPLTVGERSDFLDEGGMVRFKKTADRKIRLQVHLDHARQNGFQISAQLLRVCDVVQGGQK